MNVMVELIQKSIKRLCKIGIKRCVSRFRSLLLEIKADIDEEIDCKSTFSLRIPASYSSWSVSWTMDEKAKFHYPKLVQKEHRPITIYNSLDDLSRKTPYFMVSKKKEANMSFHLPFLANDHVIAEFVIYTKEKLSQEKVRKLYNTMDKYRTALSTMASAVYSLTV